MEQVQAHITQDTSDLKVYEPEPIRFEGNQVLGCDNSRNMSFLLGYCSKEESLKRREPIQQQMDEYNSVVKALWSTEGFPEYFYKSYYYLSVEKIKEVFDETTANIASSIKSPTNCYPQLCVINNTVMLMTNKFTATFESNIGTIGFTFRPEFQDRIKLSKKMTCYLDRSDGMALEMLESICQDLCNFIDIDEGLKDVILEYISLGCSDGCQTSQSEVTKYCLNLLIKRGYARQLTITNGSPEYQSVWNYTVLNDTGINAILIDYNSLKHDSLLMERIRCVYMSLGTYNDEYETWESNTFDINEPMYFLQDSNDAMYISKSKAQFGGHHKLKIYGRLDCPSAARYLSKGQYVEHRVFFADEETAIKAGYRPCGICMKEAYKKWKTAQEKTQENGTT